MGKKNWTNPELKQAKIIHTHSEECECGMTMDRGKKHYCHHKNK